jgi:hypothetical protein
VYFEAYERKEEIKRISKTTDSALLFILHKNNPFPCFCQLGVRLLRLGPGFENVNNFFNAKVIHIFEARPQSQAPISSKSSSQKAIYMIL